ncbi:hypothetical protein MRZ76_01840, partial [bacterium]|nr:hypothetical protein [bacterium]
MKKKSAILLSLAALALSIGAVGAIATGTDLLSATPVAVKAADEQVEELALVFPDDNKANNTVGSYTQKWTAKSGSTEFSIANFNNNNWKDNWRYIKCGSKNAASVATIQNKLAFVGSVAQVKLTIDKVVADNVNSINLIVSSDEGGKTVLETVPINEKSVGEHLFNVKSPAPGLFYKLVFDCKKSSNGVVQISKVVFSSKKGEVSPTISVPDGNKVELNIAGKKSLDFSVANLPDGATIEASSDNKNICGVSVSEDGKKLEFSAGDTAGDTTYKVVVKKGANELASFAGSISVIAPSLKIPGGESVLVEADQISTLSITSYNFPEGAVIKAESANTEIAGVKVSEKNDSLTIYGFAAGTTTYTVDILRNGVSIANTIFEGTITVNPKGLKNQSVLFGSADGSISLNKNDLTFQDGLQTKWSFSAPKAGNLKPTNDYSVVGSANYPAESISFDGLLSKATTIQTFSFKVSGNNNDTAGDISLKLDGKEIGTGKLNGTSAITVKSSEAVAGFNLSIDITKIKKGVRIYSIDYVVLDNLTAEQEVSTFVADFITSKAGKPADGDTCKVKYGEAKSAYDRMSAEAKGLFDNDEAYASSKATYDYWAAHIDSANGTKALPSN